MTTIYTHNLNEIYTAYETLPVELTDENTINFFKTFSYATIINQNLIKQNTINVFSNTNNENTVKSTIIALLNKLNIKNISKTTASLREIEFKTINDLNELVQQCIIKIKQDNETVKPITAMLCFELRGTFFMAENDEKIFFNRILLTEIRKEYINSISFESETWTKDYGEKTSGLISILYNNKIIPDELFLAIINDYKAKINFVPDLTIEHYKRVEQIICQFVFLLSSVVLNSESIVLFNGMNEYLTNELNKYCENKYFSMKTKFACENLFNIVEKYRSANSV